MHEALSRRQAGSWLRPFMRRHFVIQSTFWVQNTGELTGIDQQNAALRPPNGFGVFRGCVMDAPHVALSKGIIGSCVGDLNLSTLYEYLETLVKAHTGAAAQGSDPRDGICFENVSFSYPGAE
jgi:hypothetical protein